VKPGHQLAFERRVFSWGVLFFILSASFFTLTCKLVVWRWAYPTVMMDSGEWFNYQAAIVRYTWLAIALFWMGRLALKRRKARIRLT
jgi:hypothetical protein